MTKKSLGWTSGLLGGAALLFATAGCTSDGYYNGDVDVHGSFYMGVGYYDGFYGGPYYGMPPSVVVTPPGRPGGGGGGGMGPRPTPMPSMPMARGGGGGMRR